MKFPHLTFIFQQKVQQLSDCMFIEHEVCQLPKAFESTRFFHFADEKKQYDPTGFRDAILEGLEAAGSDLESVSKFLDVSGSKLDYRRYGVNLIEILIAGGLLGT